MAELTRLRAFAVRQALTYLGGMSGAKAYDMLERHCANPNQLLPKAIARATEQTWQALAMALNDRPSLWERIKRWFAPGVVKGMATELRSVLAAYKYNAKFRRGCRDELAQLSLDAAVDAKWWQAVADTPFTVPSDALRYSREIIAEEADNLRYHRLTYLPQLIELELPNGGGSLLLHVFNSFLRATVADNPELSRFLNFSLLERLSDQQSYALKLLEDIHQYHRLTDDAKNKPVVPPRATVIPRRQDDERAARDAQQAEQRRQADERAAREAQQAEQRRQAAEQAAREAQEAGQHSRTQSSSRWRRYVLGIPLVFLGVYGLSIFITLAPPVEPINVAQSTRTPAASTPSRLEPGYTFRDCPHCPEMVVLPAGRFRMGSPDSEPNRRDNEGPVRTVTISQPLAMGKTPVTQGQWRAVMGTSPSYFSSCGDDCPVERVSWNDAQEYIRRLNQQTGQRYRLPSEAEWEYACRAGQTHRYCGSDDVDAVGWYSSNSNGRTHPVGGKRPNAWGLYDMSGNVWEWTQDCWNDNYRGAPSDGRAWEQGNCRRRVVRGGSWTNFPFWLRSASRIWGAPDDRLTILGFRISRSL